MFKTYTIDVSDARSLNSLHKIAHRVFHTPEQKLPCPRFRPHMEGMIRVRSENPPRVGATGVIGVQDEEIPTGTVKLFFKIAEARKIDGKTVVFNPNETDLVKNHIANLLAARGFEVKSLKYRRVGVIAMDDPKHKYQLPIGDVAAIVNVPEKSILEKLMLDGIGMEKYLGIGYVDAVKIIPDED